MPGQRWVEDQSRDSLMTEFCDSNRHKYEFLYNFGESSIMDRQMIETNQWEGVKGSAKEMRSEKLLQIPT